MKHYVIVHHWMLQCLVHVLLSLLQVCTATISEHQSELLSIAVDIHLFCVLSDTLVSWSAGIRMEQLWPKAVHRQIHAKQPLDWIRWVVGRYLVGASVSKHLLGAAMQYCTKFTGQFQQWVHTSLVLAPDSEDRRHLCRCLTLATLSPFQCSYIVLY